jgi:NADH dehydrogenase FAD-containing subunit
LAWLTFVIVGARPTGVELAGAIGGIARQTLKNDFRSIRPQEAQIMLLDGAPRVPMTFPEDLAEKATGSLRKLGVQVKCGAMVQHVDNVLFRAAMRKGIERADRGEFIEEEKILHIYHGAQTRR